MARLRRLPSDEWARTLVVFYSAGGGLPPPESMTGDELAHWTESVTKVRGEGVSIREQALLVHFASPRPR